jgi:hypothetical protein
MGKHKRSANGCSAKVTLAPTPFTYITLIKVYNKGLTKPHICSCAMNEKSRPTG